MNGLIQALERRGLITTKPEDAAECCGLPRDEDGFCVYRPHHPAYVTTGRFERAMDDTGPTPRTLGEMAEAFYPWKAAGVTRGSMLYVIDQVWWEGDDDE